MRAAAVAAVLAGAGCLTLDRIPEQQCGNFVVEGSEDCDSHDELLCQSCTWRCAPAVGVDCPDGWASADGEACCPDGYRCGPDATCHRPNGRFRATVTNLQFPVDSIAVAPVDREPSTAEIIGMGDSALRVLSTAGGAIDRTDALAIDATTPGWTVGDLDGDGAVEMLTTGRGGVIGFAGADGELATFPFTTFAINDPAAIAGAPVRLALTSAVAPQSLILVYRDVAECVAAGDPGPTAQCAMIQTSNAAAFPEWTLPCGATGFTPEDLVGDRVALRPVGGGAELYAVGLRAPALPVPPADPLDDAVCFYTPRPAGMGLALGPATALSLPAGYRLARGSLVLARVGALACPSLLVPLEDTTGLTHLGIARAIDPAVPTDTCSLQTAVAVVSSPVPGAVPLVAGQLDAGGPEEVVTSLGAGSITLAPPTFTPWPGADAPRVWHSAAIGDLNHDGLPDLVGAFPGDDGATLDGEDVDVLRQRPAALGGGFAASRIFTASPVQMVRTADVDGDFYDDVVFSLVIGLRYSVEVAFGQAAGGAPEVRVAAGFPLVSELIPLQIGGPGADAIDDVVVASRGGGTVLFGSFTRQLLAPVLLASPGEDARLVSVAIGDVDLDTAHDLVVLQRDPTNVKLVTAQTSVSAVSYLPQFDIAAPELDDVAAGGAYAMVRPQQAARDMLVAVSAGSEIVPSRLRVLRIDPDPVDFRQLIFTMVVDRDVVAAGYGVEGLRAVDLDGDADPDLLLDLASPPMTLWIELQGVEATPEITRLTDATGSACTTSVPIELDLALPGRELMLGCDGHVAVLGAGPIPFPELGDLEAIDRLAAGDVSGDGVDDLVMLSDGLEGSTLSVFVQCTTRDPLPCDPIGPGTEEPK